MSSFLSLSPTIAYHQREVAELQECLIVSSSENAVPSWLCLSRLHASGAECQYVAQVQCDSPACVQGGDGGIYVGSIMKGGAVALDGRIEPGDMILQVGPIV